VGPMHPTTAGPLNNLGLMYFSQGKLDDAELLLKRALTICEEKLGPAHPNTVATTHSLRSLSARRVQENSECKVM
jgi:Tfp pilus assembly protein PilF